MESVGAALRRLALSAALIAAATLAIAAPSAGAAWTQVSTPATSSLDQVGVTRTPDGIAHLVWVDAPSTQSASTLMHSAFDPAGNPIPGTTVPVVAGWNGINGSVEIVYVPAGAGALVAVWSGFRTLDANEEFKGELIGSIGSIDGSTWSAPFKLSESRNAYLGGIGADADPRSGQSLIVGAWGDSAPGNNGYTFGAGFPNPNFALGEGGVLISPDVAIDAASGAAVAAWQSLAPENGGVFVAPLGPTAPLTAPLAAPGLGVGGSAFSFQPQRTAITALEGAPGVYLAYGKGYPSTKQILLWRVGAPQATVLLNGKKPKKSGGAKLKPKKKKPLGRFARKAEAIGIAKGDGGRVWIFWERHNRYYATLVGPTAPKVKKLAKIMPPKGTESTARLTGEGSAGALDLFAQLERDGVYATWHKQIPVKKLKKDPK